MKILAPLIVVLGLAGCATTTRVSKVESGQQLVGERLEVKVEGPWNHINTPLLAPAQAWTMEGFPIDQLLIYSGVKDGEAIHPIASGTGGKTFNFRSNMQPDEIVTMFEGSLTRGGSSFKLVKLEPWSFGGTKGLRFEYAVVRKIDNVPLSGVGFACVSEGELFAMLYSAPRLGFFPRHEPRVEEIAKSAKVRAKPAGG
jgi:hypothetical protein